MRSPESIAELKAPSPSHERLKSAAGALSGGGTEPFFAAHDALMSAERELAAAKGEQYAVSLDFPVKWDTGAPTSSPLLQRSPDLFDLLRRRTRSQLGRELRDRQTFGERRNRVAGPGRVLPLRMREARVAKR